MSKKLQEILFVYYLFEYFGVITPGYEVVNGVLVKKEIQNGSDQRIL